MIAMIKKKTSQRVCWFNWDWGSFFLLFYILINMVIFYYLIDVDTCIKVIYIDSSHTKLFRESPKYQFLAYL